MIFKEIEKANEKRLWKGTGKDRESKNYDRYM